MSKCFGGGGVKQTFPVGVVVGVVEVVALVRRVQVVHVDVEVVRRLPEVVLALVQRQADPRGGELFTLSRTALQGEGGGRGYGKTRGSLGKENPVSGGDLARFGKTHRV